MKRVHIELQRVQTWLFAVPHLRTMVGANTPLGETLRIELPTCAREAGRSSVGRVFRALTLASRCRRPWMV